MRDETGITAILSDGEGDGVGASVTASYIERMAVSLLNQGENVRMVAEIIAGTYADVLNKGGSAPGISLVNMTISGKVSFALFNMPCPIILKRKKEPVISAAPTSPLVYAYEFSTKNDMMMVFINEGFLLSGKNSVGWSYADIENYLHSVYAARTASPEKITHLLLTAANSLEHENPEHDISVMTLQIKKAGEPGWPIKQ